MSKRKIFAFLAVICIFCQLGFNVNSVKADETDYQLRINLTGNRLTVFKKGETGEYDVEVKTMACSAYDNGKPEPQNYKIIGQNEWRQWSDKTYSKYVSQIANGVFICTSPYSAKSDDTLITDLYNGIGENRPAANIWLNAADARWIYDNCPLNTSVVLYNDESSPGSANTPVTIDIPEGASYPNWDPTNDVENNPWKGSAAKIEGAKDISVEAGTEINLMEGVKGYDVCGNDVTGNILIMGVYDLKTPGTYDVTYYLKDALENQVNVAVKLDVTKNKGQMSEEVASESEKETVIVKEQTVKSEHTRGEKVKNIVITALFALGIAVLISKYVKNK